MSSGQSAGRNYRASQARIPTDLVDARNRRCAGLSSNRADWAIVRRATPNLLVKPRHEAIGSPHVIGVIIAERFEQRGFLDPNAPEKRRDDRYGEKQDRQPVLQT